MLAFVVLLAFLVVPIVLWVRLQKALAEVHQVRADLTHLAARVRELERGGVSTAVPRADVPAFEPAAVPPPPPPPPPAPEPVSVPAAPTRAAEDWETRLGTNWLNRLGALMLVIGIVLFVGYSLTQLGPAGKVTIGFVLGFALLGAGVVLEPRPAWRTYAWSLTGAGWAVVYFTAYASHAVDAARVIESPFVGTVVLLAVSAAMIAHSVRYRSEAATTLAYSLAFVGLNISPVTEFSVLASMVLAFSLLGLAYVYDWVRLPVLGSALVYVTFVVRYNPSVHSVTVLWIYWIAFEAWDLLRRSGPRRELFVVNFLGFAGASLLNGTRQGWADWLPFCLLASGALLVSSAVRFWRGVRGGPDAALANGGGYELPACASAIMLAGGLVDRFSGPALTFALLFEAELVVLAAFSLRSRVLETGGTLGLLVPLVHLCVDVAKGDRWSPPAAAIAGALVLDRYLFGRGWYFTGVASALVAAVIWKEAPEMWAAPVIAVLGAAAFRVRLADVRWSGVLLLGIAWLMAMLVNMQKLDTIAVATVALALYSTLWPPVQIAATVLVTAFLYNRVPSRFVTVGWALEASALLGAGFPLSDRTLRLSAFAVFGLCVLRLFTFDLRGLDTPGRILSFVVLGVVLLAASFVYTRRRRA